MVGSNADRACVTSVVSWLLLVEIAAIAVVVPRLLRAARGGRRLKGVAPVVDAKVSVVIPARNEALRIGECLSALRHAEGIHEVIVVDDESSDDTADVARAGGARVIAGAPLPAGWSGKVWALEQGVSAASGEVIVTLDADARVDPLLVAGAVAELVDSGAVAATVAPRFRTTSSLSRWMHAAMLTSLVYRHAAGPGRAVGDSVGNGQCMVFRREDAVVGGWFERVKGELVEDVALVRALVRDRRHVEMFDGSALLAVQMFDGARDTWRGWTRSLALGGVDSRARQGFDVLVMLVANVAPWVWLSIGVATPATAVLLALRFGTLAGTRRVYERHGIGYWLSPLADVVAVAAIARGMVAPSREWRGRSYEFGTQ